MLRDAFANLGLVAALAAVPAAAQERAGGSYELVWSDQFDTDGPPDPAKWVWDTHANKYLLLNLAVGGAMGGAVDDSIFPASFEIEHVRVYRQAVRGAAPAAPE